MMTGEHEWFRMASWTMSDNVFVSAAASQPLLALPPLDYLLKTLTMRGNLYHGPSGEKLIRLGGRNLSLAQWQARTGVDLDSIEADPRFVDPAKGDWSLADDSPLKDKKAWPSRAPTETGDAALAARLSEVRENWRTPYPLAGQVRKWTQLDLSSQANHAMDEAKNAWMGAGGLGFPAVGQVGVHGVPFRIIRRSDNKGKDIVALASTRLDKLVGQPLPAEVTVPVGTTARAIYFLHGAVHAMGGEAAQYHIIYEDGGEELVSLVSLGFVNRLDAAQLAGRQAQANIQDWSAPLQLEKDDARKVMLTSRDDPMDDAAVHYLYTLQWLNPHPGKAIREVGMRTDPTREVCVMVLAITVAQ
jgi:hypothetical protein